MVFRRSELNLLHGKYFMLSENEMNTHDLIEMTTSIFNGVRLSQVHEHIQCMPWYCALFIRQKVHALLHYTCEHVLSNPLSR